VDVCSHHPAGHIRGLQFSNQQILCKMLLKITMALLQGYKDPDFEIPTQRKH